jgi:hypothetical protein
MYCTNRCKPSVGGEIQTDGRWEHRRSQGKRAIYNSASSRESKEWVMYWYMKWNRHIPADYNHIYLKCDRLLKYERFQSNKQ